MLFEQTNGHHGLAKLTNKISHLQSPPHQPREAAVSFESSRSEVGLGEEKGLQHLES